MIDPTPSPSSSPKSLDPLQIDNERLARTMVASWLCVCILAPFFGLPYAVLFWAIGWWADAGATFGQCFAVGWLLQGALYLFDLRSRPNLTLVENRLILPSSYDVERAVNEAAARELGRDDLPEAS